MGFLECGTPLNWDESESVRDYVKQHGLLQLLNVWKKNKDREDDELRWGDEVEFTLVDITDNDARIYLNADQVILRLKEHEKLYSQSSTELLSVWLPEFGNHMIESIPSPPYHLNPNSILMVEPSMKLRRAKVQSCLPPNKYVTSTTAFPRFGLDDFATPVKRVTLNPVTSVSGSVFVPDDVMNPHPRFSTLVKNIKSRRGAKPVIAVPIYQDLNTAAAAAAAAPATPAAANCSKGRSRAGETDWSLSGESRGRFEVEQLSGKTLNPIKGQVYMDCFAFGMGMSCIQATFGCRNVSDSRYLYDQLAILAPIFLALSAATPALRGLLVDTDTRWATVEQAVDCRTEEEMRRIPKSRYSGTSVYISDRPRLSEHVKELNDSNAPVNEEAKAFLMSNGFDEILATHFAYLWLRDPMVIFKEKIELDDEASVDHFENIQSTNWSSVRFKPPPLSLTSSNATSIGWRVEFRTPDIQLTDFDNTAIVAFISVLVQIILFSDGLDLYIPISKNDVNIERCWNRDAINKEKFWFRNDIRYGTTNWSISEMTLNEILTGAPSVGYSGLVPLCMNYLEAEEAKNRCSRSATVQFRQYCDVLIKRARGEIMSVAQFFRKFISSHPDYRKDSVVTPSISRDLTVLGVNIGLGHWSCPQLHGPLVSSIMQQSTPLCTTKISLPHFTKLCCSMMNQSSLLPSSLPSESVGSSSSSSSSSSNTKIIVLTNTAGAASVTSLKVSSSLSIAQSSSLSTSLLPEQQQQQQQQMMRLAERTKRKPNSSYIAAPKKTAVAAKKPSQKQQQKNQQQHKRHQQQQQDPADNLVAVSVVTSAAAASHQQERSFTEISHLFDSSLDQIISCSSSSSRSVITQSHL